MFKVVYPVQTSIYGPNLSDAIKNYVKTQNDINLTKIIIQNDNLYRKSYINYIKKNGKQLAQINTIPLNPLYPLSYYIGDSFNLEAPPTMPNVRMGFPLFSPPPLLLPPYISPYMAL
jgi:hypothetical protein